jgi:hypothetical protein
MKRIFFLILFLSFFIGYNICDEKINFDNDLKFAQVIFVKINKKDNNLYDFSVTVRHNDEGWDHYANIWQILDMKTGTILGERILQHPHENEQPFTRSLSDVKIPKNIKKIIVRAKCNQHGFKGKQIIIDLNKVKSDEYQIISY